MGSSLVDRYLVLIFFAVALNGCWRSVDDVSSISDAWGKYSQNADYILLTDVFLIRVGKLDGIDHPASGDKELVLVYSGPEKTWGGYRDLVPESVEDFNHLPPKPIENGRDSSEILGIIPTGTKIRPIKVLRDFSFDVLDSFTFCWPYALIVDGKFAGSSANLMGLSIGDLDGSKICHDGVYGPHPKILKLASAT